MDSQLDKPNARDLNSSPGESDYFFGCWLDVNQPFQKFLPSSVPATNPNDGPWPGATLQSIQEAFVSAPHQCLIAEINFDDTPIPPGVDTGTSDKLAQRNIAWIDGPNPGISASRLMPHPIQVRPTLASATAPDELMILWGSTPKGSEAELYFPSLSAAEILRLANLRYCDHRLQVIDDHTIGCSTGVGSLIPLPTGSASAAGLMTVGLPASVKKGDAYTILVRQLTQARAAFRPPPPPPPPPPQIQSAARKGRKAPAAMSAPAPAPAAVAAPAVIEWRRAMGAFQFDLVISTKEQLLLSEERLLAVLRWIELKMAPTRSWRPVLLRYIDQIAGRVRGFGGDPNTIAPSPTGDVGPARPGKPEDEDRVMFTGKVAGLMFDRFGDFEGFVLDCEHGDREFFSREPEMRTLADRAWIDRLRITVVAEKDRPRRPISIIVRQPPAPFR